LPMKDATPLESYNASPTAQEVGGMPRGRFLGTFVTALVKGGDRTLMDARCHA